MKHGIVLLPEHEWKVAAERWRAAEEIGYHHAWTYDHLMWRWFADRPWYGSVPTLAAAATVTGTIGLGTLVATPNFRHPAVFAKDLATLDDIAGGRLVCGLGSGAPGFDAALLGRPELSPRERAERFEEFVGLLDALLTGGDLDRTSHWYTVSGATFHPRAGQRPRLPFAIAAAGPRGMALTARFGRYWVTSGPPNDFHSRPLREIVPVLRKQMSRLDSACEREGRDPADVRRLFVADASAGGVTASLTAYEDATSALEALGFTDLVVHWPRPDHPYQGDERVVLDFARNNLGGRP
ncbi:LLM class flavin-dependent oxidoreductase [Nocardiopsis algeriensis]|uniref:Alkanesulfonate monooxygenase SsuD/methylene tetrahydromethanopterin reductase-like flavin-dependent oxidoreductase (Luciferase family) n=1 Tax=Nocardiopsis algeriensis TaxID=1478215 RepID=A0A841IP08_9ACTN|nr:LLM class flavin-dependent oxidoreductase [Nocardiopsis algeriensis]MBB6120569.1 alkanesulfonate monooxygenase SsuD/methylene tetrahydromethanopterin reductase-like flavin-dependent oxidoreductase (luciferase family) [Nocardiopsis algeriensis]